MQFIWLLFIALAAIALLATFADFPHRLVALLATGALMVFMIGVALDRADMVLTVIAALAIGIFVAMVVLTLTWPKDNPTEGPDPNDSLVTQR